MQRSLRLREVPTENRELEWNVVPLFKPVGQPLSLIVRSIAWRRSITIWRVEFVVRIFRVRTRGALQRCLDDLGFKSIGRDPAQPPTTWY